MSEWQPIETAPKDQHSDLAEARLLLYDPQIGVGVGHHNYNSYIGIVGWSWGRPTHWMSLPEPPMNEAAEAYGYLSRTLHAVAPQCEPLSTLSGLCSQIDHLLATATWDAPAPTGAPAIRTAREALYRVRHRLDDSKDPIVREAEPDLTTAIHALSESTGAPADLATVLLLEWQAVQEEMPPPHLRGTTLEEVEARMLAWQPAVATGAPADLVALVDKLRHASEDDFWDVVADVLAWPLRQVGDVAVRPASPPAERPQETVTVTHDMFAAAASAFCRTYCPAQHYEPADPRHRHRSDCEAMRAALTPDGGGR